MQQDQSAESAHAGPIPPDPYAALRIPNYRRFASGWMISTIGIQMLGVAVGWELYERTHSAFALGLIGLVQALPVIILALPGGHTADTYDRQRIVIFTQLFTTVCAVGLAVLSYYNGPVLAIYVLLMAAGCCKAFNSPARASLLPLIVPTEIFPNAVTWNSGAFQFAATAGPALGGLVIHWTGAVWPVYLITAAATLTFALSLSAVRPRTGHVRDPAADGLTFKAMVAGVSYLRQEKTVLAALTLDLLAVLLGGATTLMPVFAKDILHVGPTGLGLLRASPYIGAFLMALVLAHRPPFRHAGRALLGSVAAFGIATIVFGLSKSIALSFIALLVAGAVDNISVVIRHVLVQVRTPDAVRGRVSAVNSVFIESSNELGGFESGLVAKFFGPVVSVVSGGIGTIAVVAVIAWLWPQLRRLGPLFEPPPPPSAIPPQPASGAQIT